MLINAIHNREKQNFTRLVISKEALSIGGQELKTAIPELRKEAKGVNAYIFPIGIQDTVQTLIFKVSELGNKANGRWVSVMQDKTNTFRSVGNQIVTNEFKERIFIDAVSQTKNELLNTVPDPRSVFLLA